MKAVIVPNHLRDTINARLDEAIKKCPDAGKDRAHLYRQVLAHYNEHGEIPNFEIQKNNENERT